MSDRDEDETRRGGEPADNSDDQQSSDSEPSDDEGDQGTKKRTHDSEDDDEEVDEDDLDLIQENTGVRLADRRFKRLRRKEVASKSPERPPQRGLDTMFDDDDDEEAGAEDRADGARRNERAQEVAPPRRMSYDTRLDEEDDDLDDFIVDDEGGAGAARERRERPRARPRTSEAAAELGISHETWQEMFDLFGDGSDYAYALGRDRDQNDYMSEDEAPREPKRLEDIYEPAEVEEKMFTDKDDEIRAVDLPERFQLRPQAFRLPDVTEITREAYWIADHLPAKHRGGHSNDPAFASMLEKIVTLMRVDCMEVPFIQRYRRDVFHPLLREEDIWTIHDLNDRWNHIIEQKGAVSTWAAEFPELGEMITAATDEADIKDLSEYVQLLLKLKNTTAQPEEPVDNDHAANGGKRKFKRPVRKDIFVLAKEANLDDFAKLFAIKANELGTNLVEKYRQYIPEDPEEEPRIVAGKFVCNEFSSVDAILAATKAMLAQELATEPSVRSALRNTAWGHAVINVFPTDRGRTEIDKSHPYYAFKYLRAKPVLEFKDEQFLLIQKAENEGLLVCEVDLNLSELRNLYESFYLSDNTNLVAEAWNEQRRRILKTAFEEMYLPTLKKYVLEKLKADAIEFCASQCQASFRNKLSVAPFRKPERDTGADGGEEGSGSDDEDGDKRNNNKKKKLEKGKVRYETARVLAISCGDGDFKQPAVGVWLDETGAVLDHIKLNHLHGRNRDAKIEDHEKLVKFMEKYDAKPDIVAVAGWTVATKSMMAEVQTAVQTFNTNKNLFGDAAVPVILARDDIARIYQNSKRAQEEFPAYMPLLRYCICVARQIQDPLYEYGCLFNNDREILLLRHHALQACIPEERCYRALERAMIETVNEVGVDINRYLCCNKNPVTLQFACGLGPRKASALITKIRTKTGVLEHRADLIYTGSLGRRVFMNCSGFIRVNSDYMARRDSMRIEVLDNTRIHPEDYTNARKMAADASETEQVPDDDDHPSMSVDALWDSKEHMESLQQLLLDDYAKELQRSKGEYRILMLEMIRTELLRPFEDKRSPFRPPDVEEVFTMLTGETDETLHADMVIAGTVSRIRDRHVSVRFDSGLEGVINTKLLGEYGDPSSMHEGQSVKCSISRIFKDRFFLDLSCRPSDLTATRPSVRKDPYFDLNAEEDEFARMNRGTSRNRTFVSRDVKHPLFHNCTFQQAEEMLSKRDQGSLVIRPSASSGSSHLVVTWKVAEGLYQHINVEELEKETEMNIGKTLKIQGRMFSDLDEISVTFIRPMAQLVRDLMAYQKFVPGARDELVGQVERDMLANPKRIPYAIGMERQRPGKFFMVYKLSPKHASQYETITVTPEGFMYRNKHYPDVLSLIKYFKAEPVPKEPSQRPPQHHQPPQPPAQSRPASGYGAPRPGAQPPVRPAYGYGAGPNGAPTYPPMAYGGMPAQAAFGPGGAFAPRPGMPPQQQQPPPPQQQHQNPYYGGQWR